MIILTVIDTEANKVLRYEAVDPHTQDTWRQWLTPDVPLIKMPKKAPGRNATQWCVRSIGAHPNEPTMIVDGHRGVAKATHISLPTVVKWLSKLEKWNPDKPDSLPTVQLHNFKMWRTQDEILMLRYQTATD